MVRRVVRGQEPADAAPRSVAASIDVRVAGRDSERPHTCEDCTHVQRVGKGAVLLWNSDERLNVPLWERRSDHVL